MHYDKLTISPWTSKNSKKQTINLRFTFHPQRWGFKYVLSSAIFICESYIFNIESYNHVGFERAYVILMGKVFIFD